MGSSPSVKLNAIELPPRAPGLLRTLVLLHGYGADERDLLPIAHELDPRLRAVALLRPDLVSGVVSLSGVARAVEDRDHAPVEDLRGFPVFAAHGLHDPLIPIELGRGLRDTLTSLGVSVSWHEYPMGHTVIPEEIESARSWLKECA